jgi:hypothetical protein
MTEHLPECPMFKPCCDDDGFPDLCSKPVDRCLHCMAECICDALQACEHRVKDEALAWAKAREVNGVTWVQAWAQATEVCVAAFYDRISDSDLDDVMSDDQKDIVAWEIKRASLARMKGQD